jgi:hypothetical protein
MVVSVFLCALSATAGAAGPPEAEAPQAEPAVPPSSASSPSRVAIPEEILDPPWLDERRRQQLAEADRIGVEHDFRFTDRVVESGITFVNRSVDDAGKSFKAVHYDHGNGVTVADVDGDGRLDIYFTTQLGSNELWRNLGGGRFEDITAKAGVGVPDRIGVTASFADTDNDGDADLYVTTVRGGNLLFENDGDGTFSDVSKNSGLDYVGHSSGAVFFDYDRDGLLDLFLTNVGNYTIDEKGPGGYYIGQGSAFANHLKPSFYERSILFRNLGGNRFRDVSEQTGLVDDSWSGDAAPLDLDDDGWVDLYVLNMQGHDQYWRNVEGKRFERLSRRIFPATPWGAMGIGVFDFENDGDMDILVTDMHTDMFDTTSFREYVPGFEKQKLAEASRQSKRFLATDGNHVLGNAFFLNDGEGKFREVSDAVNAENYWPWGLSVGDVNADGFQDVFIASSMNFTFRYGVNSLLLNDRGKRFADAEFILGIEPRRDGRTAKPWFEVDCSGPDREHPACEGRQGRLSVWGAVGSRASVIFDLDSDGDLDIVTNDFNSEPQVLESNLAQKKKIRWLELALIGNASNRDGLGARVTVTAGSRELVRVHDGKSGYLSQSRYPLWVGLGDLGKSTTVDRIRVRWPSGKTQTLEGPIETNRRLEVREPQDPRPPLDGAYHVRPGESIQAALELAADDPAVKLVRVHAGTYRPRTPAQALIHFNRRHDGITLEAVGHVVLTAANSDIADARHPSFPAVVNHVVYFGDGVSRQTVLRGFEITGANGFVTRSERPLAIQPRIDDPALEKGLFFYLDGGAIKIFGRSYPTIENIVAHDNATTLCGGAVSVEHRGFNREAVLIRDSEFRDNRCPATGSAIDLLPGSAAVIENCLFVGNIANTGMEEVKRRYGLTWNETHGSGALTVFHGSRVTVERSTFTGNWNGVDDRGENNVYRASIFWKNDAHDGSRPGGPYEMDIVDGSGVEGCFLNGETDDLQGALDSARNVLEAPNPRFDRDFRPRNRAYAKVGYRPPGPDGTGATR